MHRLLTVCLLLACATAQAGQTPGPTTPKDAIAMTETRADTGIETLASRHDFAGTVAALRAAITGKGLTLFALIDHAQAARDAGLSMPPTQVLVFGSPKVGTPLMLATPGLALDLPLRVLVREDATGRTWVSSHTAADLAREHGLPTEATAPLAGVAGLIRAAIGVDPAAH